MPRSPNLSAQLTADLREKITRGDWPAGSQLPTETELAAQWRVSRATVRQALRSLEEAGLVRIHHGRGSFVTPFTSAIRTGLQELRSMTRTIAEQGFEPGMDYRSREWRAATDEEAERLGVDPGARVLGLQRALTADGEVVAFCYDAVVASYLPAELEPDDLTGSVFDVFERYDLLPEQGVAEVRPVLSAEVGWGQGVSADGLYLLLEQTQYLADGSALSFSRIYFVEDRFRFLIVRKRP